MLLSRRPQFSAGKFSFVALILVLNTLLGACGFSSLYGQRAGTDVKVAQHLALIHIQPIKDRIGQHLRNNLLIHFNPKGQPANPLYTLNLTIKKSSNNLGIKKSAVVTRGNLRISAIYTLSQLADMASGIEASSLITARSATISSYDISQGQYAALAALKDAQARAIKEVADDIKTRLSVYFRQRTQ
jgi:LPS-assembly lipoprotein